MQNYFSQLYTANFYFVRYAIYNLIGLSVVSLHQNYVQQCASQDSKIGVWLFQTTFYWKPLKTVITVKKSLKFPKKHVKLKEIWSVFLQCLHIKVMYYNVQVKMANSGEVNDCVKPPFNGCHKTTGQDIDPLSLH